PRYPLPRVVLTFERRPLRPCTPADGATVRRTLRSVFLGACRAGGSLARTSSAFARAGGEGDRTGAFAPAPGPDFICNVFAVCFWQVSTMILPQVQWTSRDVGGQRTAHVASIRTLHRTIQSVGATGGVYKGQGRSQRELMTRAY
ncbi:UNVERIFIED_CONTAM: hypothetical protein Sindi_3006100, partial [Sesamum indicum]